MTEYKGIKGGKVQNFDTDPDNPYVGQVWYNQTLGDLRVRATTLTTAWASGGNLNTARGYLAGANNAPQSTGLGFGGDVPPPRAALTEQYDGTSWTEVNDLNTARNALAAVGADNTSALAFGGNPPVRNETEEWNGSSWTEVNNLNTAREWLAGAGIKTAALAFGGQAPGYVASTEQWNGTS